MASKFEQLTPGGSAEGVLPLGVEQSQVLMVLHRDKPNFLSKTVSIALSPFSRGETTFTKAISKDIQKVKKSNPGSAVSWEFPDAPFAE